MSHTGTKQDSPDGSNPHGGPWAEEETISLAGAIARMYRHRRTIMAVGLVFAILYLSVVFVLFLWTPVLTKVTLEFHLDFQGVEEGKYPNEMEFSTQDIVSLPVLTSVYEANRLESILSLQEFLDSIFISTESDAVELLDDEYRGKLSDLRLNSVDRLRLEEEYRTKRMSLKSASYSLNFLRHQSVLRMETSQIIKILADILAAWADFVDLRKGVLKYQIPTYSQNAVRNDLLKSEDYIVAADLLRSKIKLALESVSRISELPGADVIRVGEEEISLAEVKLALEETLSLNIGPLLRELRVGGVSKDPTAALNYFNARAYDVGQRSQEMGRRIETLQEALDQYLQEGRFPGQTTSLEGDRRGTSDASFPAMVPQFDSSFLDRLLELTGDSSDLKFRQEMTERIVRYGMERVALEQEHTFYQDMLEGFTRLRRFNSGEEAVKRVETRISAIVNELRKALDQLQLIYAELSARNLNPRTLLYSVSGTPEVSSERSISLGFLLLAGAASLMLVLVLTVLSCLVYDALGNRRPDGASA